MFLKKRQRPVGTKELSWVSQPMRARVDLDDKEAVNVVLDDAGEETAPSTSASSATRRRATRGATRQPRRTRRP